MALEDSKIVRKAFKTEKEIHIALGFLLGCLISALITYIEAEWSLVEITLQGLWQVHLDTLACWIADTAPFAIAPQLKWNATQAPPDAMRPRVIHQIRTLKKPERSSEHAYPSPTDPAFSAFARDS